MDVWKVRVDVTGWNAEDEYLEWTGYGETEDAAIEDAKRKGRIIEIGDVTVYDYDASN